MKTMTESEALALLAETFSEPVASLRPDTERAAIPGWDSMGALMLMAELRNQRCANTWRKRYVAICTISATAIRTNCMTSSCAKSKCR